jgi:hypothetical protein
MARPKRYSEDQIIGVLKEIEAGASIASVGRSPSDKSIISEHVLLNNSSRAIQFGKNLIIRVDEIFAIASTFFPST